MAVQAGFFQDLVRNPENRFSHAAAHFTVMTLSFRTDTVQTVQTQIRLLLEEQSDQGLHCLLFHLRLLEAFLCCKANLFNF